MRIDLSDEDTIEGLEFRDPTPLTDRSLVLRLSLEDDQRPLPTQAGKLLSDTLGSIFKAASWGYFEVSGESSRQDEDGRTVPIDVSFVLGVTGDPQPAVQVIRETLWWISAPEDTDLDELALKLAVEPDRTASRFLQLAAPKVVRWKFLEEPGHRIDRVPFSTAQREDIRSILAEVGAAETTEGWVEVSTSDGGRMAMCTRYLNDANDFDTLNVLVDVLTPEISCLIHGLMQELGFMLLPMTFAADEEVARAIDCDWPSIEVVASAARLHELLAHGPYHWWRRE